MGKIEAEFKPHELETEEGFREFVATTFDKLKEQFLAKNDQYGTLDPLANFSTGAALEFGDCTTEYMYETLKGYMGKHVAHVYNNAVNGNKVDESLKDIAIYSVIALYMNALYYAQHMQDIEN